LSIKRQCELLEINRSSFYSSSGRESAMNIKIMHRIDQILTEKPTYGSRMLADVLSMEMNIDLNRKRIQRLMKKMGVEALYPKRKTSLPGIASYIYPYLLRDIEVTRPDQVWCADITYIPMRGGYMYLFAVMDWYSPSSDN